MVVNKFNCCKIRCCVTVLKPAVGKNVVVRKKRMTETRNIECVHLP